MRLIKDNLNIDFLGKQKLAFTISVTIIIAGLILTFIRGEKNFGLDFKGGLLQQIEFEKNVNIKELRGSLKQVGLGDAQIQQVADSPKMAIIKTGYSTKENVTEALKTSFPENPFVVVREEMVGPVVGKDLSRQGVIALLLSLVGILLYVSWRFEFSFALGAVIALFHDVLVCTAFLCFTGKELTLQVLAALLTIIGYSINDTIVIFDRVREDIKLFKKEPLDIII
ncbi:protein translocase subunit SecF, partial [bacterium]|nr:protein translocase subunit SecF [bacterium]